MTNSRIIATIAALLTLAAPAWLRGVEAQGIGTVDFSQVTRPRVEVTDSATIDLLLFELFLEPLTRPDRLQVIDVTRNGFGPDDILIVYPSNEVYLIPEFVPEVVQRRMSEWQPEVEYRLDSGNMPVSTLAGLLANDRGPERQAENAIMYDLVRAVERNYRDLPVALLFQRDSIGFTFEVWGYNRSAMRYLPREDVVPDSTISTVLTILEDVGYVPGQDVAGLGLSLESIGTTVATVDHTLRGLAGVTDERSRNLAVQTVLLGSYDFDRSGSIDSAPEIDAPPCAVWGALDAVFPGFATDFGFDESTGPYLGALMLSVSAAVRAPAFRRLSACARGELPPRTLPEDVATTETESRPPASVGRFLDSRAASEIVRRGSGAVNSPSQWAQDVRFVLLDRYDRDLSGLLDTTIEVREIACDVWQAIASTAPTVSGQTDQPASFESTLLTADLGFADEQVETASRLVGPCLATSNETSRIRVRAARSVPARLPSEAIREAVTVPLRSLAGVPDEERRYLPAKTVLMAMFDTDRSGAVDRARELDAVPCDVWASLEVAFPRFARRYGFVAPSQTAPYRGDGLFGISDRLRESAERRILACERGETPPATDASTTDSGQRSEIIVPARLKDFLDLAVAADVVRSTVSARPGSTAWAAAVRAILVANYDLDASGALDRPEELDEVPCQVWSAVESSYGAPLEGLLTGDGDRFVGDEVGVAFAERSYAQARMASCGSTSADPIG